MRHISSHLPGAVFGAMLIALAASPSAASQPPVNEVRRAALRYAGLSDRPDRWSARARWRNLLPDLTATAARVDQFDDGTRFDEWLTRDGDEALLFDSARNQDDNKRRRRNDFSLRASVDLGGLVFDGDELGAAREARARVELRQEITDAVHETYFGYLATEDALHAATRAADVALLRRRLARQAADLDALTGGWYAAQTRSEP